MNLTASATPVAVTIERSSGSTTMRVPASRRILSDTIRAEVSVSLSSPTTCADAQKEVLYRNSKTKYRRWMGLVFIPSSFL